MAKKAALFALLMIFCACVIGGAGCGKKGPPQPPDERFYLLDGR